MTTCARNSITVHEEFNLDFIPYLHVADRPNEAIFSFNTVRLSSKFHLSGILSTWISLRFLVCRCCWVLDCIPLRYHFFVR